VDIETETEKHGAAESVGAAAKDMGNAAQRKAWESTCGDSFGGDGASDVARLGRQTLSGESAGGIQKLLGNDNRKGVDYAKDQEKSG
jgi:hypothetical protein